MQHVSTAPRLASKLSKSQGYTRQKLHQISKAEENSRDGARQERIALHENHIHQVKQATNAIQEIEALAAAFDTAALTLKAGLRPVTINHTVVGMALKCLRLGVRSKELTALLAHCAERASAAAEKAQDRLDQNQDNLDATNALFDLAEALPAVKFDTKAVGVRNLRNAYHQKINRVRKPS